MANYLKEGSIWRKWDLHVHSPKTFLNNQFGDCSIDDFVNKVVEKEIKAVGLTNYFKFDDSELNEIKNKLNQKNIIVFPNIEFRIQLANRSAEEMHIHIIFSDKTDIIKITNFLSRLKTIDDKYCNNLTPNEIEDTLIGFDALKDALKADQEIKHLRDYLLIACPGGQGSFRPSANNGREQTIARSIDEFTNMLFGNENDTEFFLNSDRYTHAKPKPVLLCSDAHKLDEVCSKFSWIKANLTFEGLKQTLYEPADRVKIQIVKPEEKERYQIIKKVSFIDVNFMKDEIPINQNLTVIIGGKSTGKSILLRNIAQTIDYKEVSERLKEVNLTELKTIDSFEVIWADGQKNCSADTDNEENINKKIIYIPQSYLNRLVDKEEGGIHKIIEDVLKQSNEKEYDKLSTFERKNNEEIATNIASLFNFIDSYKEQKEKIQDMGDKKGIEIEIKGLENEITTLKKASGMSDSDIEKYNNFVLQIKELQGLINEDKLNKNKLIELKQDLLFYDIDLSGLSNNLMQDIDKFYTDLKTTKQEAWKEFLNNKINEIETQLTKHEKELNGINKKFNPLLSKAKQSELLREKIKRIEEQQNKLIGVNKQEVSLNKIDDSIRDTITKLVTLNKKFYDKYAEFKETIIQQTDMSGDIEFNLEVKHKTALFQKKFINEVFDQRQLLSELADYSYESENNFSAIINSLLKQILNNTIAIKSRYTANDVITKLLKNWYMYDYKITQGSDDISTMSPGKKSFVLLKLLIELDSSKCPILLDQPEDDLDSRSIYNDLVKFIKNKKKERQIIVVTHDPNLAVGADAECVIVANQKGDNAQNKKYQFEYISGALEDTFLKDGTDKILYKQGIREHVCDILEGGTSAFEKREKQYGFK